jgi:hypothetical protein
MKVLRLRSVTETPIPRYDSTLAEAAPLAGGSGVAARIVHRARRATAPFDVRDPLGDAGRRAPVCPEARPLGATCGLPS